MIYPRKTYNSCSDLPLHNFIKIVITGELDWLYSKSKKLWNKDVDLRPVYDNIMEEYSSLSGNTKSLHIVMLLREMAVINNKLLIIEHALNILSKERDERLISLMKRMGFSYLFSSETMANDLIRVATQAKNLIAKRITLDAELKTVMPADTDGKTTEKDFLLLLARISQHMKFPIDPKKVTVMEFINYIDYSKISTENGKRATN